MHGKQLWRAHLSGCCWGPDGVQGSVKLEMTDSSFTIARKAGHMGEHLWAHSGSALEQVALGLRQQLSLFHSSHHLLYMSRNVVTQKQ